MTCTQVQPEAERNNKLDHGSRDFYTQVPKGDTGG